MTQTSELVAGREMDALVAEKVMGWTHDSPNSIWWHRPPMPHESGPRMVEVPAYSTDIATAWQVVEKMRRDRGVMLSLNAYAHWVEARFSQSEVRTSIAESEWLFGDWVTGSTAPEAICRAALAAVGA